VRILYVSDNTSDHNLRFLKKLADCDHEVFFLDITKPAIPEGWLPAGTRAATMKSSAHWSGAACEVQELVPEFRGLLSRVHPDVIQAGPVDTAGYLAALSEFHPLVIMPWGSDVLQYPEQNSQTQTAIERALSAADGLFCDCRAVRTTVTRITRISDEKIAQFPWGLERGLFSPTGPAFPRDQLGYRPEHFVFLCTRSWEPIYDITTLLSAFEMAYRKRDDLRLILLGRGSEASRIYDFLKEHGLAQVVATPGGVPRADLPAWFRSADAYISCTKWDGVSISLLEAMATGLPVIVTDIPSNREFIIEGENGYLAARGSSQAFAQRILRVAALEHDERNLFSRRNRAVIAERADWDRNFPHLLNLYEAVVGAGAVVRA
jgi:glycosyltransferase involved in cell wall biosynthesis